MLFLKIVKTVLDKKVLISACLSSVVMFSLSYLWHGVLLNDFLRIDYPKSIFLAFFATLYFVLGLVVACTFKFFSNPKNIFSSGAMLGAGVGFVVFLIAFVLGLSFSSTINFLYIAMDLVWQVLEQAAGGLAAALVTDFFLKREAFLKHQ